jgi:hypothetical protein
MAKTAKDREGRPACFADASEFDSRDRVCKACSWIEACGRFVQERYTSPDREAGEITEHLYQPKLIEHQEPRRGRLVFWVYLHAPREMRRISVAEWTAERRYRFRVTTTFGNDEGTHLIENIIFQGGLPKVRVKGGEPVLCDVMMIDANHGHMSEAVSIAMAARKNQ